MKSAPALLVACALLAAAGPAASQAPAPGPQPPQQPPAAAGTELNLRLDEAERRSRPRIRFGPAEKDAGSLPSLGANARPIDQSSGSASGSRPSPYPKDTNPGH